MQKAKFFIGAPGTGKTSNIIKIANANPLKTLVLARSKTYSGQCEYLDLLGDQIDYINTENPEFVVSLKQALIDGKYERIIVDEMNFLENAEHQLGLLMAQELFRTWQEIDADLLIATNSNDFIEMLIESGNELMPSIAEALKEEFSHGVLFDTETQDKILFSKLTKD